MEPGLRSTIDIQMYCRMGLWNEYERGRDEWNLILGALVLPLELEAPGGILG